MLLTPPLPLPYKGGECLTDNFSLESKSSLEYKSLLLTPPLPLPLKGGECLRGHKILRNKSLNPNILRI